MHNQATEGQRKKEKGNTKTSLTLLAWAAKGSFKTTRSVSRQHVLKHRANDKFSLDQGKAIAFVIKSQGSNCIAMSVFAHLRDCLPSPDCSIVATIGRFNGHTPLLEGEPAGSSAIWSWEETIGHNIDTHIYISSLLTLSRCRSLAST